MTRVALFCARRRKTVIGAWLLLLAVLAGVALSLGSGFTDVTDLPDGESARAYALLDRSDATKEGKLVWRTHGAAVDSSTVRAEVATWLTSLASDRGVQRVVSPYTTLGANQLDVRSRTAFADVVINDDADPTAIRDHFVAMAQDSSLPLDVAVGGTAFTEQPSPSGGTEVIGVLAALAVLLLAFRSAWAAALPILTGVAGVATSALIVLIGSHVVDLSSTSITMAALIGLGVGIDYALFIVNRFRDGLIAAMDVPTALARAMNTSGRAVILAGLTVAVALLAMFLVGLGILTGMAQAAAVAVVCTVLTALTLLPALLALLGRRVLSRGQRRQLATARSPERAGLAVATKDDAGHSRAARWAALLARRPRVLAAGALGIIVVLALPVLSLRVGNADASSDPGGSQGRRYTDLMTPAFGEGVDASLLLVARVPDSAARSAFTGLLTSVERSADVASVNTNPAATSQIVVTATVTPNSSAASEQTEALVDRLRGDLIPAAERGTGLEVLVGGETATNIDVSSALTSKLPLYLGVVALLGFALLVVAFRSILVPLVGALTNLATLVVAVGVITAIFQLGWGSELLGVGSGAPVSYIVPVIIVGVIFGLSMDYQVFLVSRMHEEWTRTGDNERSVRTGLAETAKVLATAATIMFAVFSSFGFSGERIVSSIGIGLAAAVLVDAFLVRMVIVPALMTLVGQRNWSYPRWAELVTPHVAIEGPPLDLFESVGPTAGPTRAQSIGG